MRASQEDVAAYVYVVEGNPLAACYLLTLLRSDSLLRAFNVQDVSENKGGIHLPPLFLIDNPELALPLSEYLRRLRADHPQAKFLVMDHEEDKENVLQMLWLGVSGFVPYRDVPQVLVSALRSVASGKMWVPREILSEYVHRTAAMSRNSDHAVEALTLRESQVLELAKRRLSNKEIADILSIRESTVKFHLSNIFSKLQVSNRHALIQKYRGCSERVQSFPSLTYSIGWPNSAMLPPGRA